MAMIKCSECGNDVSDKAQSCPRCGCPIASASPSGTVRVKMSVVHAPNGLNGNQKVTLSSDKGVLWQGNSGEVAELFFEGPTAVKVKYHLSLMHYGGECDGIIDPKKSKKYNVSTRAGILSTKLVLQAVDVFDAD